MSDIRYSRQLNLDEIGAHGQAKLARAAVLCVGAGGLGSPALFYLAAAGVGRIGLVDCDVVDESNLQRQILYGVADIGKPKVAQAREKLAALNPAIRIETHNAALNAANAPALLGGYDLILDGTDNFAAKFLINDAAFKLNRLWIYGAIQNFDGQVAVFDPARGPCYRCLFPEQPKARIMNCAEAGVIGAVAGMTGTAQALQAIQIIVGHDSFEPLIGKLWLLDGKTMMTRILDIPQNSACPVCCGDRSAIILPQEPDVCAAIREITPGALAALCSAVELVDVRESDEWGQGHMASACHVPLSALEAGVACDLPYDRPLVLYCRSGSRSRRAAGILLQRGYADVSSLAGGYQAWLAVVS